MSGAEKNAATGGASRRTLIRCVAAAGILLAGGITVRSLEAAMKATFDKPPAPLQQELSQMRRSLGTPARYVSTRTDEVLDPETVHALGTEKYVVRQFEDKTLEPNSPGQKINLNVNYYATGSSTPHVPEVCWKGAGREETPNSRVVFDVPGVRQRDGKTITVRMRMISFKPMPGMPAKNSKGEDLYSNVAYVFQVNGEYVASPQEVTSHFWKASNLYAYHSKIEVTPMERVTLPNGTTLDTVWNSTQEEAQQVIAQFIREALPAVEECLPDPAILTATETGK